MARKAKNGDATTGAPLDALTPDDRFGKHFPGIRAAKLEADKKAEESRAANSVYRGLLKAFKKEGGNADMLVETLRLMKREPDEIDRDFRDLNAYLKLAGVPVGTQLGLFDARTVATAAEDEVFKVGPVERRSEKALHAIERDGFDAGKAGKNRSTNPYDDGSPEFLRWGAGWDRGQLENLPKPSRRRSADERHANA
jgi:hypothetical protein